MSLHTDHVASGALFVLKSLPLLTKASLNNCCVNAAAGEEQGFCRQWFYRSSGHLFEDLGYPFGPLALPSWQHHQPASHTSTASSVALLLSSVLTSIVSACNFCHLPIDTSTYTAKAHCLLFDHVPLPAYSLMHLLICSLDHLTLSVLHVVHQNKCTGEAFFCRTGA